MKRSPPSFQFLAAAGSTDTMSSLPQHRGSRTQWRRGFSDRPPGNGRDQFVTGDSHFRSVRDANRGFRPVERENFSNFRTQPRYPPFNPWPPPPFSSRPPPYNPYQPFRPQQPSQFDQNIQFHPQQRSLFDQSQHFRPHQRQPFDQNQQFLPSQQFRSLPPKQLDYRNWEYAKPGPPSERERFTILSYNVLADYLAINHRSKLYFHIPHHMLDWEWRKRNIVFELRLWSADILCFQEVDRFQDLEEELKRRGYSGIWKMRTGDPVDGCAIFWRISRFKLLHEECIEFNKLGLRDNVAQICVLESINQNNSATVRTSSPGSNKVVICNIHVLYNPKRGEIKLGQVRVLLDRAYAVSKLWDDAPVVLSGDFNCTPKSPLYNFISEQKLNLSELPRDEVSGQASAEIRPPRLFIPKIRAESADDAVRAPTLVDEREVQQGDFSVDMRKQNVLDSNSEDIPSMDSLSQPQSIGTEPNIAAGSCGDRQHAYVSSTLSDQQTEETHQSAEDGCKDETLYVPVSNSKETPSSSHDEGGYSIDEMKCGFHEYTPVDSVHEDKYLNVIETGCREDMHATSNISCGSFSECSQLDLHTQNGNLNAETFNLSFVSDGHFADSINHPEPASVSNLDVSLPKVRHETSSPSVLEVSSPGSSGNLSSLSVTNEKACPSASYQVEVSYESKRVDFLEDEKMENLSLKLDESTKDGTFGEDHTSFLSELHSTEGGFPSNLSLPRYDIVGHGELPVERIVVTHNQELRSSRGVVLDDSLGMDSERVIVHGAIYDPSSWTPMEIETATGSSNCTFMEHPLKLRSTYSEVENFSGTRDSKGEPLVTSYNRCFLGTVDYIWRSEGLQTVKVLAPIPKQAMQWTPGFPTKKWGSDHIALVSELAFTPKDVTSTQNA